MFAVKATAKFQQFTPEITNMRWIILLTVLIFGIIIRSWSLTTLPNGLHWDEMDTGYQALSLFKTGKDYFGNALPVFPHSLADWRTPVFIYSAVPFVSFFGLSAMAVRLPAVVFGSLSIILVFLLATKLFNWRTGIFAAISMAASIWAVQYSRQSVETISLMTYTLIAVNLFYRALKIPKWLLVSGLFFALATASYAPGKLFIPLFVLSLIIIHFKKIALISKKYLALSILFLALICLPVYWLSVFGPAGTRFHDISIATDPTLATEIDYKRLEALIASGVPKKPGLTPRLIDKIVFNKPVVAATNFVNNYLSAFSTEYLFTRGDMELRHSPGKNSIGMLFLIDAVAILVGVLVVKRPEVWVWLLLAPISAALTREGGAHAARTLIMLPALTLFMAAGIEKIYQFNKKLLPAYYLLFAFNSVLVYGYYFSTYRAESARPFMWGFDQIVSMAQREATKYDRVIIDLHTDTLLMAYLFYARIDPKLFQSMMPPQNTSLFGSVDTLNFGNIYLAYPGERSWTDIISSKKDIGRNLVIADFSLSQIIQIPNKQTIFYPDTSPAFYIFSP